MTKLNKVLPHGELKEIFENIWIIEGQVKMPMLLPFKMTKTMTVIRNSSTNELTLVNAMPLNEKILKELSSLGDIKNTLRIGGFHGRDDNFYKEKYGTKIHVVRGQVYCKSFSKIPTNPSEGYLVADEELDENSNLPIENSKLVIFKTGNPIEGALLIEQYGGILITADSLQNTANANKYYNLPAKLMMGKKFFKPYNVGPGWIQFAKPSKEDVRSILNLDFQNVIPGHGDVVIGDAKEKFRPALEGSLEGCCE